MSITAPPRNNGDSAEGPPIIHSQKGKKHSPTEELISSRIAEASSALWWAEATRSLLQLVIVCIAFLLAWIVVDQWFYSLGIGVRLVAFIGLLGWVAFHCTRKIYPLWGSSVRPEYAARALERDMPELRQSLTSYVTLRDQLGDGTSGLRGRVVRSIGTTAAGQLRSHDELPVEATGTIRWWMATALALALLVAYALTSAKNSLVSVARLVAPIAAIDSPRRVTIREVSPGDIEAMAGRTIEVSALIEGLKEDETATCRWGLNLSDASSGAHEVALETDPVDSRRHVGEIHLPHTISGDVRYQIAAGDGRSLVYRFNVQDVPVIALESVNYEPPAYTGIQSHTSSSGAISAIDGTEVTIRARVNRPIQRAAIQFNPRPLGEVVRATAGATEMQLDSDRTSLTVTFSLRGSRGRSAAVELDSYRIEVWDPAGQTNPDPIIYPIEVIDDLPPDVSIMLPVRSPKEVPINAQQIVEVHASDPDFGLKQIRLDVRSGLHLVDEPILWQDDHGVRGNQVSEYRFRPAQHGLHVGDIVRIAAIASDNRMIKNSPSVEANQSRADSIELKIVSGQSQLPQNDPDGEGLTRPDQQPATNQNQSDQTEGANPRNNQQDSESSTNSEPNERDPKNEGANPDTKPKDSPPKGDKNQDQSGGGGGGGGQGEGQQQSDDNQSQGQPSNSAGGSGEKGGTSEPKSSGASSGSNEEMEGDSGQSPGNPSNPNSTGDSQARPSPSGSDQSGAPSSEPQPTNPQPTNPQPTEPQSTNPQSTNPASGDPQPTGSGDATGDQSMSGQSDAASRQSEDGSESNDQQSNNQQPSGQQSESQNGSAQTDSGENAPSSPSQSAGDRNKANDGDAKPEKSAPKHDGEAFERMKEYLEQKSKQNESQSKGNQQRAEESESAKQENEQRGTGNQESSPDHPAESKANGGQQKSGQDENNRGNEKGSGQSQKPQSDSSDSFNKDSTEGSPSEDPASDGGDDPGRADESGSGKETGSGDSQPVKPMDQDPQSREGGEGENDASQPTGSHSSGDKSDPGNGDENSSSSKEQGKPSQNDPTGDGSSDASPRDGSEGSKGPNGTEANKNDPKRSSQADNRDASDQTGSDASSNPSDPSGNMSRPSSSDQQGQPGTGGDEGYGKPGDATQPPDPVNADYAKKATDMVLDYLDETRDKPDSELLDELNWTAEDLKRFQQRWSRIRDLKKAAETDATKNRELEETLQSLGMRPRTDLKESTVQEASDQLRSIRDSGNRKPPPAAHRDAFDAFRRAMGNR